MAYVYIDRDYIKGVISKKTTSIKKKLSIKNDQI